MRKGGRERERGSGGEGNKRGRKGKRKGRTEGRTEGEDEKRDEEIKEKEERKDGGKGSRSEKKRTEEVGRQVLVDFHLLLQVA